MTTLIADRSLTWLDALEEEHRAFEPITKAYDAYGEKPPPQLPLCANCRTRTVWYDETICPICWCE